MQNDDSILDIFEIKTVEPFNGLFQLEATTIFRIEESIRKNGYDSKFPILVWRRNNENICIDGHQRLQAIKTLKLKNVPVSYVEFETEKEAIEYAIRIQRDRRNLSDADFAKRILLLDEVKERGAKEGFRGNQHIEVKSSTEPITKIEDSATTTAKKAGTSASKVKKVRTIKKKKPELLKKIESGEMSINKAYNEIKEVTSECGSNIEETGGEISIDRSETQKPNRISKKELRTEEFDRIFNELCGCIVKEKLNGWSTTSREYVKGCAARIKQLI